MGFFSSMFDNISTSIGCLAADLQYESAKETARKEGIDVDTLEAQLYGGMVDKVEEINTLSTISDLYKEVAQNGKKTDPATISQLQAALDKLKPLAEAAPEQEQPTQSKEDEKEEEPEQTEPVEAEVVETGKILPQAFSQPESDNGSIPLSLEGAAAPA